MNLNLTPDLEAFVKELVEKGLCLDAEDAIFHALWLLRDQYEVHKIKQERLKQMIAVGIDQLDRGEGKDGELVFSKLWEKIRKDAGEVS